MYVTTFTQFSLLVLALLFATSASAQPEFLDSGFGTIGRQSLTLPALDEVRDLILQPDGKILASGRSLEGEHFHASLVRYLPDGSLDPSFGLNGKNHLLLPQGYGADVMTLQSNGNIVGIEQYGSGVSRYQPNGYPDPSFQYSSGSINKSYYDLAIGPDDEILLSGNELDNNGERFLVSRLLPSGAKDLAFGINGEVSLELGIYERARGVVVQPDGKIVVVGTYTSTSPFTNHLIILRLNVNGTLDDSFGTNGTIDLNPDTYNADILLQPDGKILLTGDGSNFISLFRFNTDGTPDSTFGTNGEARADDFSNADEFAQDPGGNFYVRCNQWPLGGSILKFTPAGILDSAFMGTGALHTGRYFSCIAVQANSAVVAAATISDDFALTRFLSNGALDSAFNGGAIVRTSIGQSGGMFEALAVQPDGKIVAAGYNNGNWPALARLEADGSPDTDFIFKEKFPYYYQGAFYSLALQPDGKILAGGQYTTGEYTEGLLHRLLPNGSLDSSFNCYSGSVNSLVLQSDGKILTAGVDYDDIGHIGSTLARYEADGSPDPGFGVNGLVTTNPCRCDKMALQTDGKIIVGGNFVVLGFPVGRILRYSSDGLPDSTFGTNGVIQTASFELLQSLPDGRFLLAGNTNDGFAIYRFLSDGTPDPLFGTAGKKLIALNNNGIIHAMQVQPDGKILLAGEAVGDQGEAFFLLGRLLPDGAPDVSAGVAGFVTTGFNDLFAYDQAYTLAVQPDEKIVLAGTSFISTDTSAYVAFSLARYRADLTVESKEIINSGITPVLQMSPNPASDALHIRINDPEKWDVSILDTQGRKMYRKEATRVQTVSVKDWPSGIYVVTAVSGRRVFSAKVVKP